MTIDHIVPLKHPDVVGLHVRANLQYLPDTNNKSKRARLPDHITPATAVERGLAIWRKDVDMDGTVHWERYHGYL